MLAELFNSDLGVYECFDSRNQKWVAFTGYGKTKEKARLDYHLKMARIFSVPNPLAIIIGP